MPHSVFISNFVLISCTFFKYFVLNFKDYKTCNIKSDNNSETELYALKVLLKELFLFKINATFLHKKIPILHIKYLSQFYLEHTLYSIICINNQLSLYIVRVNN